MDKINIKKAMERMSQRISDECAEHILCRDCPLYDQMDEDKWCGDDSDMEDYENLVEKCKSLGIDISDIVKESSSDECVSTGFTVNDIKAGYIVGVSEFNDYYYCYAIPSTNKLDFYKIDTDGKIDATVSKFTFKDIDYNFYIANRSMCIDVIYGYYSNGNNPLDIETRPVLWRRENEKEYNINSEEQQIHITSNYNSYKDGEVFIEETEIHRSEVYYITIHKDNLLEVIESLQEIYDTYYKNEITGK